MEIFLFNFLIFLSYVLIYVFFFVHRPKIHSKSPKVNALSNKRIFPMFLIPYGICNSIIQLFRKIDISEDCVKTTVILPVDHDAKILIDIYEPIARNDLLKRTKKRRKYQNVFYQHFRMLFSLTHSMSKMIVKLSVLMFERLAGKRLEQIKKKSKIFLVFSKFNFSKESENKIKISKSEKSPTPGIFENKIKDTKSCTSNNSIEDNVLLIHGLNGSSNSTYIKGMTNTFLEKNCRVFCLNARGAQLPATSNVFNHIGMTADVEKVVNFILENYKGKLTLVGFSMGANWVAKFVADADVSRIKLAVCVCCPFDFTYLNNYFKTGIVRKIFYYGMLLNYKRYLKRSLSKPVDFSDCKFIEDVDRKLLGVLKCNDLEEHYIKSSCVWVIDRIAVPTLFLSATDDPIIPKHIVPVMKTVENENLSFALLKGGHLGFFSNGEKTAAERIVGEYFDIFK